MSFSLQTLSILGLVLTIVLQYDLLRPSRKTLPSLSQQPSELYPPDFYNGGHYLELPLGTMRYWEFGPSNGKRVVLIHGISTGSSTYDKVGRHLADNNHRVLVFDLWGRGYSDAPATYYDESLYVTQVALLLQKVGWDKTDVVGVSLGGGIATSFASFYPEKVNKLVLIAPTGLMYEKDLPWTGKLARHPLIRPILSLPFVRPLALLGIQHFYKSSRKAQPSTQETATIARIALYQFEHHPGFIRAFLGTVADFPFYSLHERYQTVGRLCGDGSSLQVLVLWGDADKTVPFANSRLLKDYIPNAILKVYPGGGHDIIIQEHHKYKYIQSSTSTSTSSSLYSLLVLMVPFTLILLSYMATLCLASWPSFTVSPFFTKVNRQHQQDTTDETSSDADDYEPLPNDQFSTGPGLHEDGTLPPALINSIPWRANASDLVEVELLCILDNQFCSKVLTALQTAAQEFTHVVHLKTKLVIRAAYYEFCEHICANDTYGLGAPSSQFTLPFKDGDMNFIYPQALAKQLSPYEYTTSWAYHDIMIELNHDPYMNAINMDVFKHGGDDDGNSNSNSNSNSTSNSTSNSNGWNGTGIPPSGKYWFKGDPAIQPYQIDFEYILLHEILHGMGFVSSWAAYFDNSASPFHTLLDGIFDPADLQFVTPSPYWSVQPPSGPTFVTGFQPNMIFDKFLFITPPAPSGKSTTTTASSAMTLAGNHTSLMELGFTMQDFCVPGDEAFIIHFVRAFQKSTQSHDARRLYSMLTEEHALTFQFGPTLAKNHNSTSNTTYNIVDYLNDTYTHMDLFTGEQTLNALNHHEQSGRLFRPGVTIAHVGNEMRDTPDFVMTAAYRQGKTLQQWVDEVYGSLPVIHYKVALNESTTVERVYKSPIGPGILRILDALGYVTILDGGRTNYSVVPLYADSDDIDNDDDDSNGTLGLHGKQQPYTGMMKKTKNNHRNVCDDMHGAMATKQKTPTRLSSSSLTKNSLLSRLVIVSSLVIVMSLVIG